MRLPHHLPPMPHPPHGQLARVYLAHKRIVKLGGVSEGIDPSAEGTLHCCRCSAAQPPIAGPQAKPAGRSSAAGRSPLVQCSLYEQAAGVLATARVRRESHSGAPSGNLVGVETPSRGLRVNNAP